MAKVKNAIPSNEEIRDQNPAADAENPDNSPSVINVDDQYPRGNPVKIFSYDELAEVTKFFDEDSIIAYGTFGAVYNGQLQRDVGNIPFVQVVAVKKLRVYSRHREREFLSEIVLQSLLRHPNIIDLIGFSAESVPTLNEEKQRLLVYQFMPLGSLYDHLHGPQADSNLLDWETRMKIAAGTASGLNYLHNEASPCVIFRFLGPTKILLDEGFHPKLSDFRHAEFGPTGTAEYYATKVKSDVYDFGVILLELITGRRHEEIIPERRRKIKLFDWLIPMKTDPEKLFELVDPRLEGKYERRNLWRAAKVALMCIDNDPVKRPSMRNVVEEMKSVAYEAKTR